MSDKPYRVYKARGRRSVPRPTAGQLALSEELAPEQAPPRERDARGAGSRGGAVVTRPEQRAGQRQRRLRGAAASTRARRRARTTAARSAAEPRARRRLRWWTIPLAVAAVLLAAVLVWGIVGYRAFASGVAVSNKKVDARTRAVLSPGAGSILTHPTTILVLGVDQRGGEPARSDTIMLMRFNPKTHSIAQLSIPRDMLVSIPGNGQSKINAAYAWGGAALSVRTVRQFTGIPVNHVMIVNMRGFPAMIDAVGGVDVYVPKTISSWYTGGTHGDLQARLEPHGRRARRTVRAHAQGRQRLLPHGPPAAGRAGAAEEGRGARQPPPPALDRQGHGAAG